MHSTGHSLCDFTWGQPQLKHYHLLMYPYLCSWVEKTPTLGIWDEAGYMTAMQPESSDELSEEGQRMQLAVPAIWKTLKSKFTEDYINALCLPEDILGLRKLIDDARLLIMQAYPDEFRAPLSADVSMNIWACEWMLDAELSSPHLTDYQQEIQIPGTDETGNSSRALTMIDRHLKKDSNPLYDNLRSQIKGRRSWPSIRDCMTNIAFLSMDRMMFPPLKS